MDLPLSSYYYEPELVAKERRALEEIELRAQIEAIQLEFPGYGYRRVYAHLLRQGLRVNAKRIRRIMRKYSLYSVLKRDWVPSIRDKSYINEVYPNLLRGLELTGLNQAWATDITYIRLSKEFVFLSCILDIYSRKIVGWSLSRCMTADFCLKSLEVAIRNRSPAAGLIHHSDRGTQYTSREYTNALKSYDFRISMSAPGTPSENAYIESFFKTLKYEEVHVFEYQTLDEVVKRLPHFLEEVYNRKRLHSSIGYCPPVEYEQNLELTNKADWPVHKLC